MQVIWHWIAADWRDQVLITLIAAVSALLYALWARGGFPRDTTSNGIAIGKAKAFDNRSLSLRIERLSAGLETLKVLTQNVQDNLSAVQERTSSESSLSVSASVPAGVVGGAAEKKDKQGDGVAKGDEKAGAGDKAGGDDKLGMAASDVLTDQLNLASQIFNLQTLFERSLSDRIISEWDAAGLPVSVPRMQTVLGFQVSITPSAGMEDCAAVVEIGVGAKYGLHAEPVSLVALMPQEKTYNAASISTSERSIGGSAVAKILNVNFGGKNRTRQYFLHRDSDTVAFERNPEAQPALFESGDKATVFGWEFRPVLGRKAVASGTRQMLAVVSLPMGEHETPAELVLEIKSRSYWRRYNRKTQTTRAKSSWLPWRLDSSCVVNFPVQELAIPNITKIHTTLLPSVKTIKWVNTGNGTASVSVMGENFFSGTRVVMGGKVYREEDGNLRIKSDQVLELDTTIESMVAGDAVFSGRYGPLRELVMPLESRPVTTVDINRAIIKRLKTPDMYELDVEVVGLDDNGDYRDYTVDAINTLPEPILFVGTEAVAMPYYYYDEEPMPTVDIPTPSVPITTGATVPTSASTLTPTPSGPTKKYVTVQARISGKMLAKSPSVSYRVPFCGLNYQVTAPISFVEPSIVRLGGDDQHTLFRISLPTAGGDGTTGSTSSGPSPVTVDLDKTYTAPPELTMTGDAEYLLKVLTDKVSKYQNLVLRLGTSESYVLRVPPIDRFGAKTAVDGGASPPEMAQNSSGAVEWQGVALDGIVKVKLGSASLDFAVYANGTRMRVYLTSSHTSACGKLTLDCQTSSGEKLALPVFVK